MKIIRTVLCYQDIPLESTFGTYREQYLWNLAWCHERYDLKSIGPEGRSWFGTLNSVGIQQMKDRGYSIQDAKVVLIGESICH